VASLCIREESVCMGVHVYMRVACTQMCVRTSCKRVCTACMFTQASVFLPVHVTTCTCVIARVCMLASLLNPHGLREAARSQASEQQPSPSAVLLHLFCMLFQYLEGSGDFLKETL
jgi:hypothetical protein